MRVKLAASLDGRTALASGESRWITSEAARRDVQAFRAQSAAILTGIGTVLADDPALTVRTGAEPRRQPLRVVLDSRLRTPAAARVLTGQGASCLVALESAGAGHVAPETPTTIERVPAGPDGRVSLPAALRRLGERQVNEVWVEAGATLAGAFLLRRPGGRAGAVSRADPARPGCPAARLAAAAAPARGPPRMAHP